MCFGAMARAWLRGDVGGVAKFRGEEQVRQHFAAIEKGFRNVVNEATESVGR